MTISIFGMGYVGQVTAACLARDGHRVIGVDPDSSRVDCINEGRAPIVEPGLDDLLAEGISTGRLSATADAAAAIVESDCSFICVGTPSRSSGALDTQYVEAAARDIGRALRHKASRHMVVMRSTVLPNTTLNLVAPVIESESGLKAGKDFGLAYYPEFLRESTAIHDYDHPGAIVFGHLAGDDDSIRLLKGLVAKLGVDPIVVDIATAEAVKYTNNAWHALKVSFANEIGNIAKAAGIDGRAVMEVLVADTRLNISPAYLRPGFAFGGSCLPKDVKALRARAHEVEVETPVLNGILAANELQITRAADLIASAGHREVGIIGLSFKTGTDDLRESPLVKLAERLYGQGYDLSIYEPAFLHDGRNWPDGSTLTRQFPHLAQRLVPDIASLTRHARTIVVGKRDPAFEFAVEDIAADRRLVDLVSLPGAERFNGNYQGICW